jgi:hypothetical protein
VDRHELEARPGVLTQEDIDLLATPSADLKDRAFQSSFDQERFKSRIYGAEPWQQLLQAHLYFDHVVSAILNEALANPDAISTSRMSFAQKVQLISALGLLPKGLVAPVEFMNSLRNKIAHQLDFEIADADVRDFSNAIPKDLREIMETDKDREIKGPLQFGELLRVLLLQIEVFRQNHVYERWAERKARIRLRTVLDKTPNVVYRE